MQDSIVISDASCIIALENISNLHLLKDIFSKILVTPEVFTEVGNSLPNWFEIRAAEDKAFQKSLTDTLDNGEASAIALAKEQPNSILLIDETKGRNVALKLGLRITGTIGIILSAKENHLIPEGKPLLTLPIKNGFFVHKTLETEILKRAGEF